MFRRPDGDAGEERTHRGHDECVHGEKQTVDLVLDGQCIPRTERIVFGPFRFQKKTRAILRHHIGVGAVELGIHSGVDGS